MKIGMVVILSFLFFFPGRPAHAGEGDELRDLLQAEMESLRGFSLLAPTELEQELGQRLDARLEIQALARQTFGEYLEKSLADYRRVFEEKKMQDLIASYEQQLVAAYRHRLIADLMALIRGRGLREVHLEEVKWEGDVGRVQGSAHFPDRRVSVAATMQRFQGQWKVVDLAIDGRPLSERFRQLSSDIIRKEYSLPVLIARLMRRDYIVLEDFSSTPPGQLPIDWSHWRSQDANKPKHYLVQEVNGKHYLAAQDTGNSVILGKFIHWNPREYPILTWCWRVTSLPEGGDERYNETNDSAAGVYVVFSLNWLLGAPKQLKYVWSSTLPVGTVDRRNVIFRPWFFVVESGKQNLGKWTFEQVDLYNHYQLKLGGKPAERTVSLQLLTDANSTKSYAAADYADLRAWRREALEQGLIVDYCGCLEEAPPGSLKQ